MPRPAPLLAALVLVAVGAAACADTDPSAPGGDGATGLEVVATTSILGDVVSSLVGDAGEVEVLMPPGTDPHSFSPSAAQAAAVRDADLVVANGLGLEESLTDLLDAAREEGVEVLELAPRLDPIERLPDLSDAHDDEPAAGEDDDAHVGDEAAGLDPHVWFDPIRMAEGVRILAEELAAVDETRPDEAWTRRGADYATELVALDDEIRDMLAEIPTERRILVTNHDAIGYFGARYDLEIVGTVVPGGSTTGSASAGHLAELAELVRETGVPAIFAENTTDDRLAAALAREVGGQVEIVSLYTDALGEAGSGADTYVGLLRTDAQLIADALAG